MAHMAEHSTMDLSLEGIVSTVTVLGLTCYCAWTNMLLCLD